MNGTKEQYPQVTRGPISVREDAPTQIDIGLQDYQIVLERFEVGLERLRHKLLKFLGPDNPAPPSNRVPDGNCPSTRIGQELFERNQAFKNKLDLLESLTSRLDP